MRTWTVLCRPAAYAIVAASLLLAPMTFGIVLYPEDLPIDYECFDKPVDEITMRIDKQENPRQRPTATVIAPNFVVTVSHWLNLVGKTGQVGGQGDIYELVDVRRTECTLPPLCGDDLAVYRIKRCVGTGQDPCEETEDANVDVWLDFYKVQDEQGRVVTIGSYGPNDPDDSQSAGPLRWGKNAVSSGSPGFPSIAASFDEIGVYPYVKYEADRINGDSGSGWFIKAGPEWRLAAMTKDGSTARRFSYRPAGGSLSFIDYVDTAIADMGGPARQPPDIIDAVWEGDSTTAWGTSGNWSGDAVPTADDLVAIDFEGDPPTVYGATISTEDAVAKELAVGFREGTPPAGTGELIQTGGTLTIGDGLYLGVNENTQGTYTISGGSLAAKTLEVGIHGVGVLDIADSAAQITLTNLRFGPAGELAAAAGSAVTLQSRAREEAILPARPLPHGRGAEEAGTRRAADSVMDPAEGVRGARVDVSGRSPLE